MSFDERSFQSEISKRAADVQGALEEFFRILNADRDAVIPLTKAMAYSALGSGKRIRPALALWTAEAFGVSAMKALPWAVSVEMVHTYSLIHDDLPCMDNDDERRGHPTNHIVHGEAVALLAGDALLTEAFGHLGASYSGQGAMCARLVEVLARAAGSLGMAGGQALDLAAAGGDVSLDELRRIHRLKTGALITAAVEGGALIGNATEDQRTAARRFGEGLGLAFQIADDLLDAGQESQDGRSYVRHLGVDGARHELFRVSDEAITALSQWPNPSPWLSAAVEWNRARRR